MLLDSWLTSSVTQTEISYCLIVWLYVPQATFNVIDYCGAAVQIILLTSYEKMHNTVRKNFVYEDSKAVCGWSLCE